jgi:hypothetical protein
MLEFRTEMDYSSRAFSAHNSKKSHWAGYLFNAHAITGKKVLPIAANPSPYVLSV